MLQSTVNIDDKQTKEITLYNNIFIPSKT